MKADRNAPEWTVGEEHSTLKKALAEERKRVLEAVWDGVISAPDVHYQLYTVETPHVLLRLKLLRTVLDTLKGDAK